MKVCPQCAEEVQDAAQICRFCGHQFEPAAPSEAGSPAPPGGSPPPPPPPPPPPGPPVAPPGMQPPPPPAAAGTNGSAIASLVLGIVWLGGIGSILALIFGYRGKRQIDASEGREGGRGMAIAGIVLGWVGVAGAIATVALVIAASKTVNNLSDDFDARSDARNMVSQVEACFTDTQDYGQCTAPSDTGLDIGSGPGQVEVTDATRERYTIVAHSRSGDTYTIIKDPNGFIQRTCAPAGQGGCLPDGSW